MPVVVKNNGSGGEKPPAGMHQAVCSRVYDLGEQEGFQGKIQHKIAILWELEARKEEGEYAGHRHVFTRTYTASLSEKANRRKDLEAWRGRAFNEDELNGFDVEKLVGVNCWLNLVDHTTQNGNHTVRMASIMPPKNVRDKMQIELSEDYTPNWIKQLLGQPTEEHADNGDAHKPDEFDDDIPF